MPIEDNKIENLLIEIRDTLKAQQKRNDEYIRKAEQSLNKSNPILAFAWWTFAVFTGTYLAATVLKIQNIIH